MQEGIQNMVDLQNVHFTNVLIKSMSMEDQIDLIKTYFNIKKFDFISSKEEAK